MSDRFVAIRVPQINVNDERVTILSWHVESGQPVKKGQPVVEVETSKSAVEIDAADDGYIHYTRHVDEELAVGDILYLLSDEPTRTMPLDIANGAAAAVDAKEQPIRASFDTAHVDGALNLNGTAVDMAVMPTKPLLQQVLPPRFSSRARALLEQRNLNPNDFAGRGLVRERDVACLLDGHSVQPAATARRMPAASTRQGGHDVPVRSQPLSQQKVTEAKLLEASYSTALASSVTIACTTKGFRRAVATVPTLRANATALVVFETARLLRQFPVFNGFCHESEALYYEEVNIGFAVDAGRGLKVLVVHHADTKTAEAIADEMHELVGAYLENRLPARALSGGTFTLTDLSGEDIETFQPLLNHNQSAILGIGAERIIPGQATGVFHLMLTFDHRLSEGRTAGRFLSALRARLAAHEMALTSDSRSTVGGEPRGEPLSCSRCMRTVDQLKLLNGYLVRSVFPEGLLCSVCLTGF